MMPREFFLSLGCALDNRQLTLLAFFFQTAQSWKYCCYYCYNFNVAILVSGYDNQDLKR